LAAIVVLIVLFFQLKIAFRSIFYFNIQKRLPERFRVAFIMFDMSERLAIKGERGHSLLL